jgi:hypothetical protein
VEGSGAAKPTGGTAGSSGGAGGKGGGVNVGGSSAVDAGGSAGDSGSGGVSGSSGASGTSGSGGSAGQIGGVGCDTATLGAATLRLLTKRELENTLNDIFPSVAGQWSDTLPANVVNGYGFENDAANVVGNQLAGALLDTAQSVATAVTGSALAGILPCSSSAADHACAQTFLDQYGQRLFRRPLTATESSRYLALFDTGLAASDFPTALKWVVTGLIQSPNAVYRSELGTVASDGKRQLSGYELATELAYTFGGTTPSQALLDKLGADPNADRLAEAKSLLATENGKEVVQHFFEAYLGYSLVTSVTRNLPDGAPPFADLGRDMVKETREYVNQMLLASPGGVVELLTSPTTYPTKSLAGLYGLPAPAADFAPVTRPAGMGIGILAQGSFLSSHANTDASSPTLRGLFPFYRLMCKEKRNPPPGVPMISSAAPANTTRERYEVQHMKQGTGCPGCHSFFDPIGFGFEHFDQIGAYRAQQNGEDINSAAEVVDPDTGNTLFAFTGQEDMMTQFAQQPETYDCFAAYMATYAFGSSESCLASTQAESMQAGTGIVEAFSTLATEPHFSQRQ